MISLFYLCCVKGDFTPWGRGAWRRGDGGASDRVHSFFTFCSQQQHSCDFSHDNCIRLTAPVVVFAFRNIDGDIEEGEQNFLKRKFSLSSVKFLTEQLEAMRMSGPALLVTKEDKKVTWTHFEMEPSAILWTRCSSEPGIWSHPGLWQHNTGLDSGRRTHRRMNSHWKCLQSVCLIWKLNWTTIFRGKFPFPSTTKYYQVHHWDSNIKL